MTQPTADGFLNGSGSKSASFKNRPIGYSYAGIIIDPPKVTQQTDLDDGSLLTWPNGEPKWQLVVKVQTNLREDEDDDGIRGIYVKGKSLTDATREAARPHGGKLLQGGHLTVTFVGEGEATRRGFSPPKHYSVTYIPPEPAGDSASFLAGPVASSPAPAAAVAAVVSPGIDMAALMAAAQVPAIPAVYAGQVTTQQWAALPPEQRANLIAAAANTTPAPAAASTFTDEPPF